MVKQPAKLWNSPVSGAITLDRCCFQIHIPTIAPPQKKKGPTRKQHVKIIRERLKTGSVLFFLGGDFVFAEIHSTKMPFEVKNTYPPSP